MGIKQNTQKEKSWRVHTTQTETLTQRSNSTRQATNLLVEVPRSFGDVLRNVRIDGIAFFVDFWRRCACFASLFELRCAWAMYKDVRERALRPEFAHSAMQKQQRKKRHRVHDKRNSHKKQNSTHSTATINSDANAGAHTASTARATHLFLLLPIFARELLLGNAGRNLTHRFKCAGRRCSACCSSVCSLRA